MKIEFITDFEARTTTGVQLIAAGRIVDLADDKALKLIDAGVAKSVASLPKFNPAALPYIDDWGRLVATLKKATTSTLNKVIAQAKTAAVNVVTDRWNIKKSDLTTTGTGKGRLKITRATWRNQSATMEISGRPLSLALFRPSQIMGTTDIARLIEMIKTGKLTRHTRKAGMKKAGLVPQGIAVQLLKTGKPTLLYSSFLARVKAGRDGEHRGVFNRITKSRLPIMEKRLITVASMFAEDKVIRKIERVVSEKTDEIFERELEYYIRNG